MSTQTISSTDTREIVSYDPASGSELGRAKLMDADEVSSAVARARSAQPAWAALSYSERAKYVLRARELVLSQLEEISTLVSRETGKPVPEAMSMEVVP